jgi:acetolactate synthase-1/3 small subunit
MMDNRFAIGVLVENKPGVLTRVSTLFARRGFNIDSLTVGETEDPLYSRLTIAARGDDYAKDQIVKQLKKLIDVKSVAVLDKYNTVYRELLLIKANAPAGKRSEIIEAANIYRASIVDLSPETLTIELTGETLKINAFIDYLRPYGIIEMCRTGISAVERGAKVLAVN